MFDWTFVLGIWPTRNKVIVIQIRVHLFGMYLICNEINKNQYMLDLPRERKNMSTYSKRYIRDTSNEFEKDTRDFDHIEEFVKKN